MDSGNMILLSSVEDTFNIGSDPDEATLTRGTIPDYGSQSRMMWLPTRGAFRVGALATANATYWKDSNVGYQSIAIGSDVRASHHSLALGYNTTAGVTRQTPSGSGSVKSATNFAVSLGNNIVNENTLSFAAGLNINHPNTDLGSGPTKQNQLEIVSIGYDITNFNSKNVAVGQSITLPTTKISATKNVVIGKDISIGTRDHQSNVIIGDDLIAGNASKTTSRSVVVGRSGYAYSSDAVSVGNTAQVETNSTGGVALGKSVKVSRSSNGVAMGHTATASSTGGNAVAIGKNVNSTGGTIIGSSAGSSSTGSTAIGSSVFSNKGGTAIGVGVNAALGGLSIGKNISSSGTNSVSFGLTLSGTGRQSVNIGKGNDAGANNSLVIGNSSRTSGTSSLAIGNVAVSGGNNSIAIGRFVTSSGEGSLNFGGSGQTTAGKSSFAIGTGNTASGDYSAAIGKSNTTAKNASAYGQLNQPAINQMHFGYGNTGTGSNATNNYETVVGKSNLTNQGSYIFGSGNNSNNRVSIYGSNNVSSGTATGTGTSSATQAFIFGHTNTISAGKGNAMLFGSNNIGENNAMVFGKTNTVKQEGQAYGYQNTVNSAALTGTMSMAYGRDNTVSGQGITFGRDNTVDTGGIAFGRSLNATENGIAIGNGATAYGVKALAIGDNITVGSLASAATNSVGIGLNSTGTFAVTTANTLSIQGGNVVISRSGQDTINVVPGHAVSGSTTYNSIITSNRSQHVGQQYGLEVDGIVNITGQTGGFDNELHIQGIRLYNYIRDIVANESWIKFWASQSYIENFISTEYIRVNSSPNLFFQHNNTHLRYTGTGHVGVKVAVPQYDLDVGGTVNLTGLRWQGDVILPDVQGDSAIYLNHYTNNFVYNIDADSAENYFNAAYVQARQKFGGNIASSGYDSNQVKQLISGTIGIISDSDGNGNYGQCRVNQVWPDSDYIDGKLDSALDKTHIAFRVENPVSAYQGLNNNDYATGTGGASFVNPTFFETLYQTRVGIGKIPYANHTTGVSSIRTGTVGGASTVTAAAEAITTFGNTTGIGAAGLAVGGKVVVHGPNNPDNANTDDNLPALELFNGHIEIDGVKLDVTQPFVKGLTYTTYDLNQSIAIKKSTANFDVDVAGKINADSGLFVGGINITDILDSAYIQSAVNATYILSVADSAYIQSAADSDFVKTFIDADYIQLTIDSNFIQSRANSGYILGIADSAYVKTVTDSAYILGIADSAYIRTAADSAYVLGIADSAYIRTAADSAYIRTAADSAYIRTAADSAYILSAADSAYVLNIADSAYILSALAATNSIIPATNETYDLGSTTHRFNDLFLSGTTIDLGGTLIKSDANGIVIQDASGNAQRVQGIDSVAALGMIDSSYVAARSGAVDIGQVAAIIDSAYIFSRADSAYIHGVADSAYIHGVADSAYIHGVADSAYVTGIADSAYIHGVADSAYIQGIADSAYVNNITGIGTKTVDFGSHKIEYSNNYASLASMPSATEYAGMFAFQGGKPRVASAGTWQPLPTEDLVRTIADSAANALVGAAPEALNTLAELATALGNDSAFSTTITNSIASKLDEAATITLIDSAYIAARSAPGTDSAAVTGMIDSAYIAARSAPETDSAAVTGMIDSAYVLARSGAGTDSAAVIGMIDSAYVLARSGGGGASVTVSITSPVSPSEGDMWFDPEQLETYVYYTDSDTSQWVKANPSGISGGSSGIIDSAGVVGMVDSAYIAARSAPGTDSAAVTGMIDSAYINARVTPISVLDAWTEVTSTPITAVANQRLILDTSGGVKVVNLPTSATLGDEIRIIDGTGNASTNNITINRNGHKIEATDSDLVIDVDRAAFGLVYYNAANGWLFTEK